MKTVRKQVAIISGASSMVYQTVNNHKEAYQWIKSNLTEAQQACVRTKNILIEVPTLGVSRP